ncbi:MAG TPA: 1-phosphofructokinase family hexose kinase [Puia sp.]|nr:1-phosphofructokinase family hexose kinase [Puia sp.]
MATVVTLTFNPSVDKSISVSRFEPEKKMYCAAPHLDPGGGGINVARCIKRLDGDVIAIYPAGGYHGQLLNDLMKREQVQVMPITARNDTRENWIIFENSNHNQYHFVMPGPVLNESEWQQCLYKLESIDKMEFIVVSGSMPPDFPKDIFEKIGKIARHKKAKLIVDTSDEALELALRHGVYMIKPNLNELAYLIKGFDLGSRTVAAAAKEIIDKKFAEIVVVSMGAGGAILVDANTTTEIKAPSVRKMGTVGAGDSMTAGIVQSLVNRKNIKDAVMYGVACGSATTMNPGTELFHRDDAEHFYAGMKKELTGDLQSR